MEIIQDACLCKTNGAVTRTSLLEFHDIMFNSKAEMEKFRKQKEKEYLQDATEKNTDKDHPVSVNIYFTIRHVPEVEEPKVEVITDPFQDRKPVFKR